MTSRRLSLISHPRLNNWSLWYLPWDCLCPYSSSSSEKPLCVHLCLRASSKKALYTPPRLSVPRTTATALPGRQLGTDGVANPTHSAGTEGPGEAKEKSSEAGKGRTGSRSREKRRGRSCGDPLPSSGGTNSLEAPTAPQLCQLLLRGRSVSSRALLHRDRVQRIRCISRFLCDQGRATRRCLVCPGKGRCYR